MKPIEMLKFMKPIEMLKFLTHETDWNASNDTS